MMPPIWPRFADDSSDFAYLSYAVTMNGIFQVPEKDGLPNMRDRACGLLVVVRVRSCVRASCSYRAPANMCQPLSSAHTHTHTQHSAHIFGLVPVRARARVTPIRENMSVSTSSKALHTNNIYNNPKYTSSATTAVTQCQSACARFSSEMFADQMGERVCVCVCACWPPYHHERHTHTHTYTTEQNMRLRRRRHSAGTRNSSQHLLWLSSTAPRKKNLNRNGSNNYVTHVYASPPFARPHRLPTDGGGDANGVTAAAANANQPNRTSTTVICEPRMKCRSCHRARTQSGAINLIGCNFRICFPPSIH